MEETELLQRIQRALWPTFRTLQPQTSVPVAFLAALTANESGGEQYAKRFESEALLKICLAAAGRKEFTDPSLSRAISQQEWLDDADHNIISIRGPEVPSFFLAGLRWAQELSASHSYTQLMGWHALEWKVPLAEFYDPALHFRYAVRLLAFCAQKYQLALDHDFEPLLRCWNTGQPNGKTFDPEYVSNGLRRMQLYQQLQGGTT